MYTKLVAVGLVALLTATGTWRIQDWRYGKQISDIRQKAAEDYAAQLEKAQAVERKRYDQAMEAMNAAREREAKNRVAAAAARAESERLRDDLQSLTLQLPSLTAAAVRERAAAFGELLGSCAAEYQDLAGKAQRHADDVRTLIEAWPKQ